jgi:aminopeptidase N
MRALSAFFVLGFPLVFGCSSEMAHPPADTGGSGGTGGTGGTGSASTGSTGSASMGSTSSTSGASTGGTGPTTQNPGAVQRYNYSFDVATAHATVGLDIVNHAGDCFSIGSEINAATHVTWNGAPATSSAMEGSTLKVCGKSVAAGEPLTITSEVDVPSKTFFGLDVGFSRKKDMAGGDFTYLLSWVGGCDRFGPCDDNPARLTTFHFDVTHDPNNVILCPGTLTPGNDVTRCDLTDTLAPTYSAFAIAADPLWKRNAYGTAAGVDLVFYEVPGGALAATLDKASVTAYMQWITGLLGPFPYGKELRFAGAPTAWLGFEHPANIILHEALPSFGTPYQDTTMHVLMHEIAHQWAGDRSTLSKRTDFVWKEATSEYLSYVFEDEQRPPGEASTTRAYWDGISLQSQYFPRPTDVPAPEVQTFYGDTYGPGPMVLYVQLEAMLGRQTVLEGIQGFLLQPGARSVADLCKALSIASGQDLKPYFNAWVFGTGKPEWPSFVVSTEQTGDQVTVTVTQQNASKKLYGCKVEILVQGDTKAATAVVDFGVAPENATAKATVTLVEPVKGTVLDPDHRLVGRLITPGMPVAPEPMLPVWPL